MIGNLPSNDLYEAALNRAALFELSGIAAVALAGPDAVAFLNNIGTADFRTMPTGGGGITFFCDHRGKALFLANVLRLENEFLLDSTDVGNRLLEHLDKYLISEQVELSDVTSRGPKLHLAGPHAAALLDVSLQQYEHVFTPQGMIRRLDRLGIPGFDLFITSEQTPSTADLLKRLGAVPGTSAIFEVLRIEAGKPRYGHDFDETRFVMEIPGAEQAVCYTKGCFLGQEPIVMSRDRAGGVSRLFLGMKVLDGGPPAHGTAITKDGVEVGVITSACQSPRLGAPLALGYLKRPHAQKGLTLKAGEQSVEVLGYPPLG